MRLDNPVTADRPAQIPDASPADELIERVARTGDRAAFAELFRLFAPRLKSYLMRQGCDFAVAEELMQETMVMVWRRAASFDRSRAGVATWLFTIARNKRIDALRRQRRPDRGHAKKENDCKGERPACRSSVTKLQVESPGRATISKMLIFPQKMLCRQGLPKFVSSTSCHESDGRFFLLPSFVDLRDLGG